MTKNDTKSMRMTRAIDTPFSSSIPVEFDWYGHDAVHAVNDAAEHYRVDPTEIYRVLSTSNPGGDTPRESIDRAGRIAKGAR